MKNFVLLLFAFFWIQSGNAQFLQLSSEAEISVLTVGPGLELNDSFGHTAIRIQDPQRKIDYVFDYGRFDFNTPNFYFKFAQGQLPYQMGGTTFDQFLANYKSQKRSIKEQRMQLSQQQKQSVFDFLQNNAKPENKTYKYDFFYDNCATRPVDVFRDALKEDFSIEYGELDEVKSHRDLIHEYVANNSWGSLGIDIALGSVIDKPTTEKEYQFLPDYAMAAFAKAKNNNLPLVKEASDLFVPEVTLDRSTNFFLSPLFLLGILALLLLYRTYKDHKSNKGIGRLDLFILCTTGLIGIIVCLLWFATDHSATKWNYNLLWAFPTHILAAFVIVKANPPRWIYPYMKLALIMLVLLAFHHLIGVQKYALTLLPLLLAIGIRYVYVLKELRKIRDSKDA